MSLPDETTVIKILYRSSRDNNIQDIEMTLDSIARWFQAYDPDKSVLFDPTKSYLLADQTNDISKEENISDDDNLPSNLYFALCIYKECWKDLPKEMKKPSRKELTKHLNEKGVINRMKIDAIITISAPDEHVFGGIQSSDLISWKPLSQRMVAAQ